MVSFQKFVPLWSLQHLLVEDGAWREEIDEMEANPSTDFGWDLLSDGEQAPLRPSCGTCAGKARWSDPSSGPEVGGAVRAWRRKAVIRFDQLEAR